MAIIQKPKNQATKDIDAFINAAPDALAENPIHARRVRKGKKVQITLTIAEPLLDRVDERALNLGQSRAAIINLAIVQALENGFRID